MARNLKKRKKINPVLIIAFILGVIILIIPIKKSTNFFELPQTGEESNLSIEMTASKSHIQKDDPEPENRKINYQVKVSNNAECIRKKINAVFLIDTSGSTSDYMSTLKEDAIELINSIDSENDQVSIITYKENIDIIQQFTNDKEELTESVNGLSSSGLSNLKIGIQSAASELERISNDEVKSIIVIFSDGLVDRPDNEEGSTDIQYAKSLASNEADKAKGYGIEIATIAYGNFAESELLKNISSNPIKAYVYETQESRIEKIYSYITSNETTSESDLDIEVDLNTVKDIVDVSDIKSGGIYSNGKLNWFLGSLQCSETAILSFSLSLNNNSKDLDIIDLIALLDDNKGNVFKTSNIISTIHTPNMNFTVSDNKSKASPDDKLEYEVSIENLGSGNVYIDSIKVSLSDLLNLDQLLYSNAELENNQLIWTNSGQGYTLDGSYDPTGSSNGNSLNLDFSCGIESTLKPDIYNIETKSTITTKAGNEYSTTDETEIPYLPDLYITKKSKPPTYTYGGGSVAYTLEIGNKGYLEASNVVITDEFDSSIMNISAEGAQIQGNYITWDIESLAKNETKEISYTAIMNDDIELEGTVRNKASISSLNEDYDNSDNISYKELQTTTEPQLEIEKSTENISYTSGSEFEIKIEIYNNSYSDAYNIYLEDTLPENFEFIEGSPILNDESFPDPEGSNKLVWSLGNLEKDTSFELIYKVEIAENCIEDKYNLSSNLSWKDPDEDSYYSKDTSTSISVSQKDTSSTSEAEDTQQISFIDKFTLRYNQVISKLPVTGESAIFTKVVLGICLAVPLPITLVFNQKRKS